MPIFPDYDAGHSWQKPASPGTPAPAPDAEPPPAPAGASVMPRGPGLMLLVAGALVIVVVVVVVVIVVARLVSTSSTTTSSSGAAAPAAASQVLIKDNEDVFVGNASSCLGSVTLRLKWVIANVPAGSVVVVDLSGPGLPPQITFKLGADGSYEQDYTVQGSGTWSTTIISINNQPPPALHSSNAATARCS